MPLLLVCGRLFDELVISAFRVLMILAVAPRMMRYRKTSFRGVLRDLKRFSVAFERKSETGRSSRPEVL